MRDYERLPQTLANLHVIALVCLILKQAANYAAIHNSLQDARAHDKVSVWRGPMIRAIALVVAPVADTLARLKLRLNPGYLAATCKRLPELKLAIASPDELHRDRVIILTRARVK